MSILRSSAVKFPSVIDDGSLRTEFVQSSVQKGVREIKDEKGKVISTEEVDVAVVKPIPVEEFSHKGEICEMYSLQNLQKAGVTLQPVSNYMTSTLEDKSKVQETLNDSAQIGTIVQSIENGQSQNQETIKFD